MRVPDALAGGARFSLKVLLAEVLFCGVALEVLELGPTVLEQLRGDVDTVELCGADVARDVVARRKGVRGGESDGLADDHGAQELA